MCNREWTVSDIQYSKYKHDTVENGLTLNMSKMLIQKPIINNSHVKTMHLNFEPNSFCKQ